MPRYLLDTNTASYAIKGTVPAIRQRIRAVPLSSLCISVITEAELLFGAARRPENKKLPIAVDAFLKGVDTLPWDSTVARRYAALRAACERGGKSLAAMDMLIAAHAVAIDAVLVSNDKAFQQLQHLAVEDWSR